MEAPIVEQEVKPQTAETPKEPIVDQASTPVIDKAQRIAQEKQDQAQVAKLTEVLEEADQQAIIENQIADTVPAKTKVPEQTNKLTAFTKKALGNLDVFIKLGAAFGAIAMAHPQVDQADIQAALKSPVQQTQTIDRQKSEDNLEIEHDAKTVESQQVATGNPPEGFKSLGEPLTKDSDKHATT